MRSGLKTNHTHKRWSGGSHSAWTGCGAGGCIDGRTRCDSLLQADCISTFRADLLFLNSLAPTESFPHCHVQSNPETACISMSCLCLPNPPPHKPSCKSKSPLYEKLDFVWDCVCAHKHTRKVMGGVRSCTHMLSLRAAKCPGPASRDRWGRRQREIDRKQTTEMMTECCLDIWDCRTEKHMDINSAATDRMLMRRLQTSDIWHISEWYKILNDTFVKIWLKNIGISPRENIIFWIYAKRMGGKRFELIYYW